MDRKHLKILIVTNNYKPYAGGVVSSIDAFMRGLRQLGHEVQLVTLDFTGHSRPEEGIIRLFCPVRFQYKKNPLAIPWRATRELKKVIKQYQPDIVHSQHPFLLGISALNVCNELKIPIVFTHHTQYAQYAHYIPLPGAVVRPVINRYVQQYAQKVDGIIAPSSIIKQELQHKEVNRPISVLPSPILPLFFDPPSQQDNDHPIRRLLTVSRFTKEKNIPFLLDMFARLPQDRYSLTLIGFGSELGYLRQYAYTHLRLSKKNVKFIVRPPKKRLLQQYQSSDLFVFASLTETQGLVLAEAMASGLPVITLDSPALRDIVKNNINGACVTNMEQMCQVIEETMNEPALYRKLQEGAYTTASRYSLNNLSTQLVQFYTKVANQL